MTGYAPFRSVLIDAKTVNGTVSAVIDCQGYTHLVGYVIGTGTISAGAVTFEEATFDPTVPGGTGGYAGTWDAIGSPVTGVTDTVVAEHLAAGAYDKVRARITTGVTGGGSLTVVLCGQSS
jgi:hypothetical protein